MSKSDVLENIVLDIFLGAVPYTPPANVSVALYTTAPGDPGGGVEVSGGGYARVTLANNLTNWPSAASGAKSNGVTITFPYATANWGTVAAFAVFDNQATPRLMYWGPLDESREVLMGDTPYFGPGELTVTEE